MVRKFASLFIILDVNLARDYKKNSYKFAKFIIDKLVLTDSKN